MSGLTLLTGSVDEITVNRREALRYLGYRGRQPDAGIGALFRAPLAGALFAVEIFYSNADIEYEVLLPSFVASAVAYTIFSICTGWHPLFAMPDCAFDSRSQCQIVFIGI